MLLPTCPDTPMTRKTLQEEDLQREQPTLLFLPSPRVKNNCIGTHGKAGKPDGKRNQELRVNIPSAYTLYYIIYLLLHSMFSSDISGVGVPCRESQDMTAQSLRKLLQGGWREAFACRHGSSGWKSWVLLCFRYSPTASSFPWSHSMGEEKVLPTGRNSGTAELKPFFVLFKTNKWLHPPVYMPDINCNSPWFEFKPKLLPAWFQEVRKLSENPSPGTSSDILKTYIAGICCP